MTCSPPDSPASRSAWPDSERERMMTVTSGHRLSERFTKSDPLGSLARTLLESSRWFSPARRLKWETVSLCSTKITYTERSSNTSSKPSAKTLSMKDTPSSRLLFRLAVSARPTAETAYGLLPTVQTQGLKQCNAQDKTEFMLLGLLPTPMSTDAEGGARNLQENRTKNGFSPQIKDLGKAGLLPTPTAQDGKNSTLPPSQKDRDTLPGCVVKNCQHTDGQTSQLNPLFVAEMMGFPSDWLVSPFQSGEQKP